MLGAIRRYRDAVRPAEPLKPTAAHELPADTRRAIGRAVEAGVPPAALGFLARWWQFETWLRQLVHIELRAKYGSGWIRHLATRAPSRVTRDQVNAYMATPDASNVLAYLDAGDLLQLVDTDEH